MSNWLAIAAVTATLRSMLTQEVVGDTDLVDTTVTVQPPDKARGTNNANQLNLFLYQAAPNAAWRNMEVPRQGRPGETAVPPLALNLFYLVTAYGRDNDDIFAHRLLARAMSLLHDYPVLSQADIIAATATILPANDLANQLERVRFTLQPLSLEEIFRLWAGFQTQYRLSAAYEAAVVLIDSTRSARTPLPVLARGQNDRGVASQADLIPPFPALESLLPPNQQTSARQGDVITLNGHHLNGNSLQLRFATSRLDNPIILTATTGIGEAQVKVTLPNDPLNWPAGFYELDIVVSRAGEQDRVTNELPMTLAPRIQNITATPRDIHGNCTITLICNPNVRPAQRVALLLGDREILAQPHPSQTDTLTFAVTAVDPGPYFVRLRVDGVDSLLIDRTTTPPSFDPSQRITLA